MTDGVTGPSAPVVRAGRQYPARTAIATAPDGTYPGTGVPDHGGITHGGVDHRILDSPRRARVSHPSAELTHISLELLDVTCEAATTVSATAFDRLIEHLARQFQDADLAARAQSSWTPSYLSAPQASLAERRAAAVLLRNRIAAGNLPGNRASQRLAASALATISTRSVQAGAPEVLQTSVRTLAELTQRYAVGSTRVRDALARGGPSPSVMQSALRLERALVVGLDAVTMVFTGMRAPASFPVL